MAKITRKTGNVEPFATNSGIRHAFNDPTTTSDTLDDNVNSDLLTGWGAIGGVGSKPRQADFDAMGFTVGQYIAYLHQMGVPEWDSGQEYHTGSVCQRGGRIHLSLTDTNVGNDPTLTQGTAWSNQSGGQPTWTTPRKIGTTYNLDVDETGGGVTYMGGGLFAAEVAHTHAAQ